MVSERDLFEEEQDMVAMSFGDHIEELRYRLLWAILGLGLGVIFVLLPIFWMTSPPNLGGLVMQGMQEPAQQALDDYHAQRLEERIAIAEEDDSYTPLPARISTRTLQRALSEVVPGVEPPPEEDDGVARIESFIELPMEVRDAESIQLVRGNVETRAPLVSLAPLETAVIYFTVCLISGLVFSSPWVFYQLWAFVAAGLYRHERSYVYRYLPFSLGLFLSGVLLCYFGVLPLTLGFLLKFNVMLGVEPNLRLTDWMGFATVLPLVFGIGFQTPLVMLFLGSLGILRAQDFRTRRKFAILITVVVAAILTPDPSMVSQLMLALPMVLLYEVGILLVARVESKSDLTEDA